MKRLLLLAAASITLSAPAFAQAYQCVGGELLGGPANYGCETNAQGQITSVGPRTSAPKTTTVRRAAPAPVTTTRRAAPMVTHSPAPRVTHRTQAPIQYARPSTTRTVTSTHAPTRTYSQSHSHGAGQPLTHTHSHTHYNTAPVTTHRPVTRTYSAPVNPTYAAPVHRPAPVRTYSQPTTTYSRPIYTPPPRVAAVMRPTCDQAYTRLNDTRDGRKRYEVCYADLTPVTIATADNIYDRISSAARKACRGGTSLFGNDRSCRRDAIYRAVVDVNLPALDSYYANKTGRHVPRVTVGPLRRN